MSRTSRSRELNERAATRSSQPGWWSAPEKASGTWPTSSSITTRERGELAHAAGDLERARTYEHHARGFLIIAARRSARLAPADAVARYAQAIASTDDEDPSRPELLLRMAEALADTGDGSAAADALDRAIEALRASGEIELEAAALGRRAQVAQSRGDARLVEFAAQSVALLAPLPASPALLDAYAGSAAAQLFHGRTAESIETATGAIALRSFHRRRASAALARIPRRCARRARRCRRPRSDAPGRRSALRRGSGRAPRDESSSLLVRFLNNLALARVPIEGPGKALPDLERAIALGERARARRSFSGWTRATKLTLLFQLGRIAEAEQLAAALGDEARRLNLTVLTASTVAWQTLCCYVRTGRLPEDFALEQLQPLDMYLLSSDIGALVAAVTAVARARPGRRSRAALRTLDELASTPNLRASWEYPRLLPLLVREAIALGDIELAERARAGVAKLHRLHELALASSAAALSEARGDDADALDRYAHVAAAWDGVRRRARARLRAARPRALPAQARASEPGRGNRLRVGISRPWHPPSRRSHCDGALGHGSGVGRGVNAVLGCNARSRACPAVTGQARCLGTTICPEHFAADFGTALA